MTQAFAKFGVTTEHLEKRLGHKLDSMLLDELVEMMGIYNALREGEPASEYFGQQEAAEATASTAEAIKATAAAAPRKPATAPATKPAPAAPAPESKPVTKPSNPVTEPAAAAPVQQPAPAAADDGGDVF